MAAGCHASPPAGLPAADEPTDAGPDAGPDARPDAEPITTCCRLGNERGERLDYKCGIALNRPLLEEWGYRCWLVQ